MHHLSLRLHTLEVHRSDKMQHEPRCTIYLTGTQITVSGLQSMNGQRQHQSTVLQLNYLKNAAFCANVAVLKQTPMSKLPLLYN
jgi:hypothetical protein